MQTTELTLMGGVCPNCSGVVLAPDDGASRQHGHGAEFVVLSCGLCGLEFTSPADDLLFHAVPLSWFSQGSA